MTNGHNISALSSLPAYDPAANISRAEIINSVRKQWTTDKRALLIEAQAGQGKTTLALQMLAESNAPSAWHQLDTSDGDPVRLLATLHALFGRSSGFASPLVSAMLANGEIDTTGAIGALELLLKDLASALSGNFYLVLDDVYLLEEFPLALALLGRLLEAAPPRLKLILISRRPILPLLQSHCSSQEVIRLGNADLALSRTEVATLFNDVLHLPIATDAVYALHRATEGWIMGMMLMASRVEGEGLVVNSEGLQTILNKGREAIPEYFINEVLENFPPPLRRTLAKLALLQEIPLALAQELSEVDDIAAVLADLQGRNFFVRSLEEQQSLFAFHHLFQDCLRRLLERDFSAAEIDRLQCCIACWYSRNDDPEKALHFFISGHDYATAEQVLQKVGTELHAHNRIISLQSALAPIPNPEIVGYPWLAYYRGVVAINMNPPTALPWFEQARLGFCAEQNELGELMALVQILYFHMAIDSRHNLSRVHLPRASELYELFSDRLTIPQQITAANTLLVGHAIINNDIESANRYYDTGLKLLSNLDLKNLEAEARLGRCLRGIFLGDHPGCAHEIEQSLALIASPRVTAINKAMLLLTHLNLLVNQADHEEYIYRKTLYRSMLGEEIFDRSVLGAFVRLWDIDMYFARGEMKKARNTMHTALAGDFAGASAHLRSQYLQYQAFLLAVAGEREQALTAAEESLQLRAEVGCPFFISFNASLIGATYAQLGMHEKAEALFDQSLCRTDPLGDFYARPTALAHRSYWRLARNSDLPAQQDLRELLDDLKRKGFSTPKGNSASLRCRISGSDLCLL